MGYLSPSGIHFIQQIFWDTSTDFTIYCNACLEGMGFWVPDKCVGFYSPVPQDLTEEQIFYFEVLCVLLAIHHLIDTQEPLQSSHLFIYTNNNNTVTIFNTLHCLPHYNNILIDAADTLIHNHLNLCVLHIDGELNFVADAISRKNFAPTCAWNHNITLLTPSISAGGCKKMISSNVHSRQPHREVWTHKCLIWEHEITLSQAVNNSTWKDYGSSLNSYMNFIKMHDYPLEPTPDTLNLFTVYMCHHIKPDSVSTYLSGICHQLEPYFSNVCTSCNSALVHRTLQGCNRICAIPTSCKRALTISDLKTIVNALSTSTDHDGCLFLMQLLTGFFALFRLSEMTYPNDLELHDPRKVTK
jgi:hypothetical protein